MWRYRMYVDESGDHTYSQLDTTANRYLALMGIVIEQAYYRTDFHPALASLKQEHFPHNPDDPVILVRNHIMARRGPFSKLADPSKNAAWEEGFLNFLAKARITLFTVVIDKRKHLARYKKAAYHPYHFCMLILLERLRGFLLYRGGQADVMAESRGWKTEPR